MTTKCKAVQETIGRLVELGWVDRPNDKPGELYDLRGHCYPQRNSDRPRVWCDSNEKLLSSHLEYWSFSSRLDGFGGFAGFTATLAFCCGERWLKFEAYNLPAEGLVESLPGIEAQLVRAAAAARRDFPHLGREWSADDFRGVMGMREMEVALAAMMNASGGVPWDRPWADRDFDEETVRSGFALLGMYGWVRRVSAVTERPSYETTSELSERVRKHLDGG